MCSRDFENEVNFSTLINFCRLDIGLEHGGYCHQNIISSLDCPKAENAGMVGIKPKV